MLKIQVDSRNRIMFIKKDVELLSILERESFSDTCEYLQRETGYKVLIIRENTNLEII